MYNATNYLVEGVFSPLPKQCKEIFNVTLLAFPIEIDGDGGGEETLLCEQVQATVAALAVTDK